MAVAWVRIDQGAGGDVASIYDRVLSHERKSRPDQCLRFVMRGDWSWPDVFRWVRRLARDLSELVRDSEPAFPPCGSYDRVGYRFLLVEGRIAIECTWQASPERPSWPVLAVQLENLGIAWQDWELLRLQAAAEPVEQLARWLRIGVAIVGAFYLGPPLLRALEASLRARSRSR